MIDSILTQLLEVETKPTLLMKFNITIQFILVDGKQLGLSTTSIIQTIYEIAMGMVLAELLLVTIHDSLMEHYQRHDDLIVQHSQTE